MAKLAKCLLYNQRDSSLVPAPTQKTNAVTKAYNPITGEAEPGGSSLAGQPANQINELQVQTVSKQGGRC